MELNYLSYSHESIRQLRNQNKYENVTLGNNILHRNHVVIKSRLPHQKVVAGLRESNSNNLTITIKMGNGTFNSGLH